MKTIVYYYTLTGQCEKIAEKLSTQLNCTSERIIEKKKRISRGFLRFLNGRSALKNEIARIETLHNNPDQYEKIIVVTPFWAASPTPAVRGFVQQFKEKLIGKSLGLVMTNLGSDPVEALHKYQELFPEKLTTLSLTKAKNEWTDPTLSKMITDFVLKMENVKN